MECSCRLWPMPGMDVVTSTEFVKRTRATLRSAEFGFLGVCVYTRMHTPRFSGQPINAGDLVLTWTCSRPIRTSCENVGTVISLNWCAQFSVALARRARKNARERTATLKGLLRIRRHQQETPCATPRDGRSLLASIRRGLLGFAGLASHSGRSSVPFRRAMFRDRRIPSNYDRYTPAVAPIG